MSFSLLVPSQVSPIKLAGALLVTVMFKSITSLTFLWLPEAMEGPTPVSSLLHSATLVMAGVFLLVKFHLFLSTSVVMLVSCSSLAVAKFTLGDADLKKLVASSTIVLTGFILLLVMSDFLNTAIGVTIFHAGYKAVLFMTAGKAITETTTSVDSALSNSRAVTTLL